MLGRKSRLRCRHLTSRSHPCYETRVAPLLKWLEDNWFSLLQSIGIISGFVFTALTLRRDTKSRKRTEVLALTQQHRELWSEVHRRPELARILQTEVNLVAQPISTAEEEYLNLIIIHFNTGWQLAREGASLTLQTLRKDVRTFFSLPVPRAVWEQSKSARDPEFVRFVEKGLPPRVSDHC